VGQLLFAHALAIVGDDQAERQRGHFAREGNGTPGWSVAEGVREEVPERPREALSVARESTIRKLEGKSNVAPFGLRAERVNLGANELGQVEFASVEREAVEVELSDGA
jgi:hypothetical protein